MNARMPEQLDKILAMADSSHEGEAIVAVRKARQMLSQGGLSFGDLARAAFSPRKTQNMISFFSGQRDEAEASAHHMRQQIEDLRAQLQTQDLQLDFWRRRAQDMENAARASALEIEKLKKST